MSKNKTLRILNDYLNHCQTTVNEGEPNDINNLENAKKAVNWVNKQKPQRKQLIDFAKWYNPNLNNYDAKMIVDCFYSMTDT